MSLSGLPALIVLFMIFVIPIGLITLVISTATRLRNHRKLITSNVIIAEYEPPEHLSPAEIGYLFDSKIGKKELLATVIQLEQRGLLTITGLDQNSLQATLSPAANTAELKQHEQFIITSLQGSSKLSFLTPLLLLNFSTELKMDLSKEGYLRSRREVVNYFVRRLLIAFLAITAPLLVLIGITAGKDFVWAIIISLALIILFFPFFFGLALIAAFIYSHIVGQPGMWSIKIKSLWPQLEGYREYLKLVELDELQFESEDLKQRSQNNALPYAVALNLSTDFSKRFG